LTALKLLQPILAFWGFTPSDYWIAKDIREDTPVPSFTNKEAAILRRFFTNTTKNTFLVIGLPQEVVAVLLAMYSRMKNDRGIRGVFLKLTEDVPVVGQFFLDTDNAVRQYGETTLIELVAEGLFEQLKGWGVETNFYKGTVTVGKIKGFLQKWLDSYGHNSIARTATLHICVEQVSTIAAKALEWARMGTGYIELSTRYVSMSKAGLYPIWRLTPQESAAQIEDHVSGMFDLYQSWDNGQLEGYWSERWPEACMRPKADQMSAAVIGKAGDTLGNILPTAALTSLGISVSGESMQSLLRHLYLDGSPECIVIAEEIISEAETIGSGVFLRHHLPNDYHLKMCAPYTTGRHIQGLEAGGVASIHIPSEEEVVRTVCGLLGRPDSHFGTNLLEELTKRFGDKDPHESHNKLPRCFEGTTASFTARISFRSFRDLQRHQLCTHLRSRIDGLHGIYVSPDMPEAYMADCQRLHMASQRIGMLVQRATVKGGILHEYLQPMGTLVNHSIAGNLRQLEFLTWQRSSWSVHHEVRDIVLGIDRILGDRYSWWKDISRTDRTPGYIFSRADKDREEYCKLKREA
jgi:thymidylate synthase ThyX